MCATNGLPPLPEIPPAWLPDTSDPEWCKLDAHRQADVRRCLRLLTLIHAAHEETGRVRNGVCLAVEWARALDLGARDRLGRPLHNSGLSRASLLRLHYHWQHSEQNWKAIARYLTLVLDKSLALRRVALSKEQAKFFFQRNGGLAAWCRSQQIAPLTVRALLAENRCGGTAAEGAALVLRRAIDTYRDKLAQELRCKKQEQLRIGREIMRLERIAGKLGGFRK